MGLDCQDIVNSSKNFEILRDVNLRFVSREVYDMVIDKSSKEPEFFGKVREKAKEYGKWLGRYAKVRFQGDELEALMNTLQTLYSRPEEKYTIHINNENNVTLQRISMFDNTAHMDSESCIYVGVFEELGYELVSRKVSENSFELIFKKK